MRRIVEALHDYNSNTVQTALGVLTMSLALAAPAAAAAEPAASVNFGSCQRQAPTELRPLQAPGQAGNGPLTIVNGDNIIPHAFAGAVGCET